MSITNYAEAKILDALFNNTSLAVANTYVKLHLGDPGEDATSNPAAHTTRVEVTWAAASGGAIASDNLVSFTSLAASETITHISIWDASTNGNPLWSGALAVSQPVIAGGQLDFQIGAIQITLN